MSKSNAAESDYLKLLFNGTPIANIADNALSSPLTNLYVSLHTADPGEAGNQTTNETTYTGYARAPVARASGGWVVTGSSVSPAAAIDFPACLGGTATITHFAVGTSAGGAGKIEYSGTVTPNIAVAVGTTPPQLTTATSITED
jgi:hypothetical protein